MHNLGDEDDVAFGFADTAASIVADETEARDAGGTNLAVQTGSVRNPFERLSANGTTVIHLFSFSFGLLNEQSTNPNFGARITTHGVA